MQGTPGAELYTLHEELYDQAIFSGGAYRTQKKGLYHQCKGHQLLSAADTLSR